MSTHKTPAVREWLEAHPRVSFHFTPTSASWWHSQKASIVDAAMLDRLLHRSVEGQGAMSDDLTPVPQAISEEGWPLPVEPAG